MDESLHGRAPVDRRAFLKAAGLLAGAAAAGCDAPPHESPPAAPPATIPAASPAAPRDPGFDPAALLALAEVVLPGELEASGRAGAVRDFVAWVAGYAPVAEQMHGYGDAEIRYLPPDPAPGWRAQLEGLDLLARRSRGRAFAALPPDARRALVEAALANVPGERLPAPLAAAHVAVALVAHWASRPAAWDLAFGARIAPRTCRPLADAVRRPLPLAPRS